MSSDGGEAHFRSVLLSERIDKDHEMTFANEDNIGMFMILDSILSENRSAALVEPSSG